MCVQKRLSRHNKVNKAYQLNTSIYCGGSYRHPSRSMKHGNFKGLLYTTELVSVVEIINISILEVSGLDPGQDINYPEVCTTLLSHLTQINPLQTKRRLLYLKTQSYRSVNTFHLGYKNQSVYAVSGTSRCLFSDKYKTHKYSVGRAYSC